MNTWSTCLRRLAGGLAAVCLATFSFASDIPSQRVGVLNLRVGDVQTASAANILALRDAQLDPTAHYVIQLDGPITPQRRADLIAAGVELGEYLPAYAYVVTVDAANVADLASLPFVAWMGEYQLDWKIDPDLGQRAFVTPQRQALAAQGDVLAAVNFFEGVALDDATKLLANIPGASWHIGELLDDAPTVYATIPQAQLAAVAALPEVSYLEDAPEITLRNSTDRWIVQSNIPNVTPLYNNGLHGEGQIVGVLDSQLDANHCSFVDTQPIGPNHRKIVAYNTSQGAVSHGTHVCGTAAGDAGVNDDTRGVAYLAKIAFNDIPSFTESATNGDLTLHHSQGARVHTNSWGDDGTTAYNSLCRGFDVFLYNNEDSFACLAVTNGSSLKNPENAKNLLAVGASQDTPNQANHCSGGVGPTSDGRRKPEIYAPGCSTNSSASGTTCGTRALTGTSMASPAIAGAALLTRQYYTDGYYPTGAPNPGEAFIPSGALVKATLLNSAVDMTGISGYPSNLEGWGRVLADNALFFPGDARKLFALDIRNADGLNTNDVIEQPFTVLGSSEVVRVTAVWTEPAAASGASFAQVNNLDLEVVAPDGTLYKGNVFSGGFSASGGSADDRNNVEQVHVNNPLGGGWVARVVGTNVAQGTQGFALVITGDIQPEAASLSLLLPGGVPNVLAPDAPASFDVRIIDGEEIPVPGSAKLYYRYDGGAYIEAPLAPAGGEFYTATLPAPGCSSTPEFYVGVLGDQGTFVTQPRNAPADVYTAAVGVDQIVFQENFEADSGWVVGAPSDTATTGIWSRMVPEATAAQPGADHSDPGTQCWVTDGRAGTSVGTYDIDGGATTLTSPFFDLSGAQDPTVSYWRWFSNNQGSSPGEDVMLVQISADGLNWVTLETVGPTQDASGGWIRAQFRVRDFVGLTNSAKLRFIASDAGAGSIVEAAVDDLQFNDFVCESVNCPGDYDSSGTVDLADLGVLLGCYGAPCGDLDGDNNTDLSDLGILLSNWGGC